MRDSGATFIVTVAALVAKVEGAVAEGVPLQRAYLVGDDAATDEAATPPRTPFSELLSGGGATIGASGPLTVNTTVAAPMAMPCARNCRKRAWVCM